MIYDCIVVGAGPAGLSAALMLGRSRRRVLVCDTGTPRNRRSHAIHGYLTRDGTSPEEFHWLAREELRRYETVELRAAEVTDAAREGDRFEVRCAQGNRIRSRKLLLATGVADDLPEIAGLEPLYGSSVHHCPYCDAWEWRDQPIAIYGRGQSGVDLALSLTVWSADLLLCTDGPANLPEAGRQLLEACGVGVREEPVVRLEGRDGQLERIVFAAGEAVERRALFFATGQRQRSDLPARLECRFTDKGAVETGECEATNVPGLYVCGDASKHAQFVAVAAAEGAEAGMAINRALLEEALASPPTLPLSRPAPTAHCSDPGFRHPATEHRDPDLDLARSPKSLPG